MVLKRGHLESRSEIPERFGNVVLEKISWTDRVRNEYYIESRRRGIFYMK
jgi:hypothetical protein